MKSLPISVIVIARNAERTIGECLSAVKKNKPAEIIVVDGNSTDRTVEIARRYTEHIYTDEGKGIGYARQLGTEMASEEYIAFVDSDIFLTEGALATMFSDFKASDYTCVAAQPLPTKHPSFWERWRHEHYLLYRKPGVSVGIGLWRRETILKYKFDPFMDGAEDPDLQLRLEKEKPNYGISLAFAYHSPHKTGVDLFITQGRQMARLAWKHGLFRLRFCPPLIMLYRLGLCLVRGKPQLIPYIMVIGIFYSLGMIKGFVEIIKNPRFRPKPSFRFSI